jgi:ubiquinone/menaquinone biosynthesis C-methylase UbiE
MQDEHGIAVNQTIELMPLKDKMKVLDIGCGNGYAVRQIAKKIYPDGMACGVDISSNMIQTANNKSTEYPNTHFQIGTFDQLPFNDQSFDIVLSVESIYYAENLLNALKEIKRITRPGGTFYCITYFFKEHPNSAVWKEYIPITMHYLSENMYIETFKEAGFNRVETKRLYDHRPVKAEAFQPKWGYDTIEELIHFRTKIGALLVIGSYDNESRNN